MLIRHLADEPATVQAGGRIGTAISERSKELLLTLEGELGAGKTTLARAILRALGATGPIRSPTYTLVEPYDLQRGKVLHLDLYRLAGADELDLIGYRDLRVGSLLTLLEWPERAAGSLGPVDLAARLAYEAGGRRLELEAGTPAGQAWLEGVARRAAWPGG